MSRLQVWVELIVLPLGSLILIGLVAILLFTMCVPSTRKWPVAPESENAHSMFLVTWTLSKILADNGNSFKLLAWITCCHALARNDCGWHGYVFGAVDGQVDGTLGGSTVGAGTVEGTVLGDGTVEGIVLGIGMLVNVHWGIP